MVPNKKCSFERSKSDALKCKTRLEFGKSYASSYQFARKGGFLDQICGHMPSQFSNSRKWPLNKCMASASNYETRNEWQENVRGAYEAARRNNWLEVCCKHMQSGYEKNLVWTLEACKRSSSKYESKQEWRENEPNAYHAACSKGWLKVCQVHMPQHHKLKQMYSFSELLSIAQSFGSRTKWFRGHRSWGSRDFPL